MIEYDDIDISAGIGQWKQSRSGNYIYICDNRIAATVFNPPKAEAGVWRIIINRSLGGYIVQDEYFTDVEGAQERAEAILDGSPAKLKMMRPKDG
ncbi:hypothetical protein MCEREM21A_00947 [Sphingomonadaceae bacterium]